jgi:hypothetical protein
MSTKLLCRAAVLSLFALVTGCARVTSGAEYPVGFVFDRYRTYDWGGGDTLPVGDPRLDNNPFFDARVRSAVDSEFLARGLRRDSVSPDLLVHYHASIRQRVDVIRVDEARGYSVPPMRSSERTIAFDEGTLIVDVVEPRGKVILWRGWSQTDVGGLVERPREMEKRIGKSVHLMMRQFPRGL